MAWPDMEIRVAEECGPHCVSPEDGERLFGRLREALRAGKSVELDFAGVETIATVFLNVAIGKLFGEFKAEQVEPWVQWKNADETDDRLVKLVMENAKSYYRKDPNSRNWESQWVTKDFDTNW